MTKREKIKILEDAVRHLSNSVNCDYRNYGMCVAVCESQRWWTTNKGGFFDLERAKKFLSSVGINKPKNVKSDYWYPLHDDEKRIRIMQRAIKRLSK